MPDQPRRYEPIPGTGLHRGPACGVCGGTRYIATPEDGAECYACLRVEAGRDNLAAAGYYEPDDDEPGRPDGMTPWDVESGPDNA